MTTLTASRLTEMPRVNLLPPEIEQASKLRRLQVVLALALLAIAGLVVLLFLWAGNQVSSAEDELAIAETEGAALQAKVASFAEVPAVLAEVDAAEAALQTAMTPEVRFSYYLNDLSLGIPSSTRLTSLTAINSAAAVQLDPSTVVPPTQLGEPTMGSITYTGMATDVDATAAWMISQMRQEGLTAPQVQMVAESSDPPADPPLYTFESTVEMGLGAASERFTQIQEGS
jgi:Tfp pilus assembly protein PilN